MRYVILFAVLFVTVLSANADHFISVTDPGKGAGLQFQIDITKVSQQQVQDVVVHWPPDERIGQKDGRIEVRDPAKGHKSRSSMFCVTCQGASTVAPFAMTALTIGDAVKRAQVRCRSSALSLDLGKCVKAKPTPTSSR